MGSDVVKQKKRQDLVRDQIRQVVTDLEDVLGGLKQVHVEMKEVGGSIIIDVYSCVYIRCLNMKVCIRCRCAFLLSMLLCVL